MLREIRRQEAARVNDALDLELREEAEQAQGAFLASARVEDACRRLDVALRGAARIDGRCALERCSLLAARPLVVAGLVRRGRVRADEVTRAEVRVSRAMTNESASRSRVSWVAPDS